MSSNKKSGSKAKNIAVLNLVTALLNLIATILMLLKALTD